MGVDADEEAAADHRRIGTGFVAEGDGDRAEDGEGHPRIIIDPA